MADTATLTARLTEAETAYHKLATGSQVASVNIEGEGQVTYSKADMGLLSAYISDLRSQLAGTASPAQQRRPLYVSF